LSNEHLSNKNESEPENQMDTSLHQDATWGPWLFRMTMLGTLVFMWWLVIYDHGVLAHHH
jgi:hypothetical protein